MKRIGWAIAVVTIAAIAWHVLPDATETHPPCREATASLREEDVEAEATVRAAAAAMGMPDREPDRGRRVEEFERGLLTWGGEWAWSTWTQVVEGGSDLELGREALRARGFRAVRSDDRDVVMRKGGLEARLWMGIPHDRAPRSTSVTVRGGCRHPQPGEHAAAPSRSRLGLTLIVKL
jgi:hypothetical protein